MFDHYSCGLSPAEAAAEAAEAERETAEFEAQRAAEREAYISSLPTKHHRHNLMRRVRKNFDEAMRRARNAEAVPPWLTDADKAAMLAIYQEAYDLERLTGVPHEVDHIVQLVGKNKAGDQVISGLHVPWNLRAIPWKMNRMRGDWFYILPRLEVA